MLLPAFSCLILCASFLPGFMIKLFSFQPPVSFVILLLSVLSHSNSTAAKVKAKRQILLGHSLHLRVLKHRGWNNCLSSHCCWVESWTWTWAGWLQTRVSITIQNQLLLAFPEGSGQPSRIPVQIHEFCKTQNLFALWTNLYQATGYMFRLLCTGTRAYTQKNDSNSIRFRIFK